MSVASQLAAQLDAERQSACVGLAGSAPSWLLLRLAALRRGPLLVVMPGEEQAQRCLAELRAYRELLASESGAPIPKAFALPSWDVTSYRGYSPSAAVTRARLSALASLSEGGPGICVTSLPALRKRVLLPEELRDLCEVLRVGQDLDRDALLLRLAERGYLATDQCVEAGSFAVRGGILDVFPVGDSAPCRLEFWGDEIDQLSIINPLSGETVQRLDQVFVYPAKHFVMPEERIEAAVQGIRNELRDQLEHFKKEGKLLEAQRLNARTRYDIEMLQEVGYCSGVENYSRHLSGRKPGQPPDTLYDFFPEDFLLVIDESHVTVPQVRAMWAGDRSRKTTLVEHGFRLPSALDNRPMTFDEWESKNNTVIYVSATPGNYELEKTGGEVVEQIIRPTGLLDPEVEVRPAAQSEPNESIGDVDTCLDVEGEAL